jgi:hypothetical protein
MDARVIEDSAVTRASLTAGVLFLMMLKKMEVLEGIAHLERRRCAGLEL